MGRLFGGSISGSLGRCLGLGGMEYVCAVAFCLFFFLSMTIKQAWSFLYSCLCTLGITEYNIS